MKHILFCIFLSLSVTLFSQEGRLALVIGNSEYEHGAVVDHAVSDAYLISFTLEDLGFDVISATNASHDDMEDAIAGFWEQLPGNDVALVYFAGHGIQHNGVNYLVPVDAKLKKPGALKKETINVDEIASQFERQSTKINMAILDACGDEPFRPWIKEGSGGLAVMTAPKGSIIALTAAPGATVPKHSGSNGLYAENLTRQMMIPQPIGELFSNTTLLVSHASKGTQNPKEWSQFTGSFSLTGSATTPVKNTGSVVLTSQVSGNLYLNGLEIASVEPNSMIPLDNMESGTYELSISGQDSWQKEVLVLGNQVTNVSATAASKTAPVAAVAVPTVTAAPVDTKATPAGTKRAEVVSGEMLIDSRDHHEYPVMEFGTQTWMTANLSFDAGDGSHCYDGEASNCGIYGRLYTWEAAQKVCPEGWHLPSDEEWMVLEQFIGMKAGKTKKVGLRGKVEGDILKDTNQGLWPAPEEETSNANGFNALPGGYYLNNLKSAEKGESAILWTSTEYKGESVYYRKIEASKGGIHRYYSKKSKGYAVRCIKD